MDDERFDGLYMNVTQTTRGIEPMLDTVFSFLRRKTDFFSGPPGAEDGPAAAIATVNKVLKEHAERYKIEKVAADAKKKKKHEEQQEMYRRIIDRDAQRALQQEDPEIVEMSSDGGFDASTEVETKMPVVLPSDIPSKESQTESNENDDDDEGPPPEGNGGTVPGKYVWTQTLAELTVVVPVPDNTRGRDVQVVITPSHLKVALKSNPTKEAIVDADLTKRVVCDDSFWTIEDGNRLVINLQKKNEMEWWDAVCKGDPGINVRHIRPENSNLSDLDGETRKTVEKMMFDQRQKAMGQPTSDQQSKLEAFEKFKKQHPELDYSNVNIS